MRFLLVCHFYRIADKKSFFIICKKVAFLAKIRCFSQPVQAIRRPGERRNKNDLIDLLKRRDIFAFSILDKIKVKKVVSIHDKIISARDSPCPYIDSMIAGSIV